MSKKLVVLDHYYDISEKLEQTAVKCYTTYQQLAKYCASTILTMKETLAFDSKYILNLERYYLHFEEKETLLINLDPPK